MERAAIEVALTPAAGPASSLRELALEQVVWVGRGDSLGEVAGLMREAGVGVVLVVGDHPTTIVSERHVVGALADGLEPDAAVAAIDGERPATVSHRAFVWEAAELMVVDGVADLVVIDDDRKAVGILSARQVIAALLQGVDPRTWAVMLQLSSAGQPARARPAQVRPSITPAAPPWAMPDVCRPGLWSCGGWSPSPGLS